MRFLTRPSVGIALAGSLLFLSCSFAYKKHIVGNYYIIGIDSRDDITLSYSLPGGNYVGKAPGILLEYGYNDSVLVAKTKEYGQPMPFYYIIDMKKDFDVALEENFRVGPIDEKDFNANWLSKINIKMRSVNK